MSRRSRRREPPRHLRSASAPARPGNVVGLLLLNVVFPGAPRFLRGGAGWSRWIFLLIPALFWAAAAYLGISILTDRSSGISLITHPGRSLALIIGLLALALWYLVTFLDIFGLIKYPRLRTSSKALTAVLLVPLLVLTSGGAGYGAYLLNVSRNALSDIFTSTGDPGKPVTPFLNPVDGRYNFLVMGGDAGEDRVGRRPDSIMAISVDAVNGATTTISIPRNFQGAPFPASSPLKKIYPNGYNCGDECILGNLYSTVSEQYGSLYPGVPDPGAKAMMETASEILGIAMQAYVIVDMNNFSKLIDLVGGVKVNAGGWVPISGQATDNNGGHLPPEGWIAPGLQTLNGYQALWYARSREWTTDYARSLRQQCVVQSLVKQMDPLKVLTKFAELAQAGTQIMESDITTEQLSTFLDLALKSQNQAAKRLTLGPPDFDTQFPTYPDFGMIRSKVNELLGKSQPATPTQAPPAATGTPIPPGQTPSTPMPPASPSSTPTQTQQLTQQYLQQLAKNGATQTLVELLANNGNCMPG